MKYVLTRKIALVDEVYDLYQINQIIYNQGKLDKDFWDSFPAPIEITIPQTINTVSEDLLHLLATYYTRGTLIKFENSTFTLQHPRPRQTWMFKMIDDVPSSYIASGNVTTKLAYEYGQKLISAVYRHNNIPYSALEEAYKALCRPMLRAGMKVYSRNAKTLLEARAELETASIIEALNSIDIDCPLTDEELLFYARAFDVNIPKYFLRANLIKTDNGYAICPFVSNSDQVSIPQFTVTSGERQEVTYAMNEPTYDDLCPQEDRTNPQKRVSDRSFRRPAATLRKDANPYHLCEASDKLRLYQQVKFFLDLPRNEQELFLSNEYDYCQDCGKIFKLTEGCCSTLPCEDQLYIYTRPSKVSEKVWED